MIPYNTEHDPPAPTVELTVASTLNRRLRQTLPALLDTGADITAIPEDSIEKLQLYPISQLRFEDLHATTSFVYTYKVRIAIGEVDIATIEVIPTGLEFAILGRDVLNRFDINLYGPQLVFTIGT